MEKPRFRGFVGIGSVDAVHVGPDDEFFGVHDVRDEGTGKIGAVAAERGDAAVGRGADEARDDRDDAVFKQREKNGAAALSGLLEMWLGIAETVAGEDKFRRRDGYRGHSGFFERGRKEARAQAFAERGEAIEKLG